MWTHDTRGKSDQTQVLLTCKLRDKNFWPPSCSHHPYKLMLIMTKVHIQMKTFRHYQIYSSRELLLVQTSWSFNNLQVEVNKFSVDSMQIFFNLSSICCLRPSVLGHYGGYQVVGFNVLICTAPISSVYTGCLRIKPLSYSCCS